MAKVWTIGLTNEEFDDLIRDAYIVTRLDTIAAGDYILFNQTESNRNVMARVTKIIQNDGFKSVYALISVTLL